MKKSQGQEDEQQINQKLLLAEAHESLLEFQRTGLHLTGPEVFEWLDNWHDPEYPDPECHQRQSDD